MIWRRADRHSPRAAILLAPLTFLVALSAGCADDAESSASPTGTLDIVASFYPLQFAAERVGGDAVQVSNLTPAGVEPHDVELTAADTVSLEDADLVVYLSGFSPAVDDAIDAVAADHAFDAAEFARLDIAGDGSDGEGNDVDPHFWLDPTRLADVADQLAGRLAEIQPANAAAFKTNAAALRSDLHALDTEFGTVLATCANRNLVTSHVAFAYLADRYDMIQLGIAGLSPDSEPSPQDLADVAEFVAANNVTTIYYETLVSPAVAETIAAETGARTDVLDPLEGLSDESQGNDYLEVMRANLENLRRGQGCT